MNLSPENDKLGPTLTNSSVFDRSLIQDMEHSLPEAALRSSEDKEKHKLSQLLSRAIKKYQCRSKAVSKDFRKLLALKHQLEGLAKDADRDFFVLRTLDQGVFTTVHTTKFLKPPKSTYLGEIQVKKNVPSTSSCSITGAVSIKIDRTLDKAG